MKYLWQETEKKSGSMADIIAFPGSKCRLEAPSGISTPITRKAATLTLRNTVTLSQLPHSSRTNATGVIAVLNFVQKNNRNAILALARLWFGVSRTGRGSLTR